MLGKRTHRVLIELAGHADGRVRAAAVTAIGASEMAVERQMPILTAALGDRSFCEVDVNDNPLRTELCGDAIKIKNGRVDLPKTPGLVTPPNPSCLKAFADEVL